MMESSKKRKKDAYTEAHNDYYPLVFSTVYTKVGDVDDTRDICQEVFISFYEKFDEVENPRKWLYGAARIELLNYFKGRRGEVNIDGLMNDFGLTFVNGFRESRLIISEVLNDPGVYGDEIDSVLFNLVAVSNLSYSQTGKELGLSKRQVEYRYSRLVERILERLKKKGIKDIEDLL